MPTDMPNNKTRLGGASKAMTSMAFIVSVVVHLIIFLFVGSVVIFEGAIPPNLFTSMGGLTENAGTDEMELPPLLEEEIEPEPLDSPVDELVMDTEIDLTDAMATSDLIISNTVVPTFTPSFSKPNVSVGSDDGTKIISGIKSKGGSGKRGPGAPRTANIFGKMVTAENFGAILDISFSTHKTINNAVDEIKSGFPDAVLVLTPGCGMSDKQTGEIVAGKKFEDNIDDYYFKGEKTKDRQAITASFLEHLVDQNKDFKKLWSSAVQDERAYVLFMDLGNKLVKDPKGGMRPQRRIEGTQHAFEFLIKKQGCDVIYWMADFDDKINEKSANEVIKEMKRNDIKLIQHDFDGAKEKDAKNRSIMKKMVKETGGEQIIGKGK